MRNQLKVIACFTALAVLFSSCSKQVYGHQEFMDGLKTKKDVISHFGGPFEYKLLGDTSKWLYNLNGQQKISQRYPDPISKNSNDGLGQNVSVFHYPRKMVLITFKNDSVINYYSQGVDYTLRKPDPLRTAIFVVVVIGTVLGIAALSYTPMDSISF